MHMLTRTQLTYGSLLPRYTTSSLLQYEQRTFFGGKKASKIREEVEEAAKKAQAEKEAAANA